MIFITIFYHHICRSQAQTTVDFYVDNQATTSYPNGTEQNPFIQLFDTFTKIKDSSSPASQINIHIAPSPGPYNLSGSDLVLNSESISSLTISRWISQDSDLYNENIPTLDLLSSSILLENMTLFGMKGINMTNKGGSITLNNTPFLLQDSSINIFSNVNQSLININNGTNVIMNNIQIYQHSSGSLLVDTSPSSSDISLTNIQITLQKESSEPSLALFILESDIANPKGSLNITNLTLINPTRTINELSKLLTAKGIDTVLITNMSFNRESYNIDTTEPVITLENINNIELKELRLTNSTWRINSPSPFISINNANNLIIQSISFSNNNITTIEGASFCFFEILNLKNIKFYNQSLYQNKFTNSFIFYSLNSRSKENFDLQNAQSLNLEVDSIMMSENIVSTTRDGMTYINLEGTILEELNINNIEYSRNQISCQVFSIKPDIASTRHSFDISFAPKLLKLSNMIIQDNSESFNTTFLYFWPSYDQEENYGCLQPAETFALSLNNLTVSNNSYIRNANDIAMIYQGSLFQVKQAQFHLNGSNIQQNVFDQYNFLTLGPKPCSIIITSSQISNNNFTSSQFIMGSQNLEYICSYTGNELAETNTPLYRYNFILDSKFMNNSLIQSTMFDLTNGFIAFHNNEVNNEYYENSQLISILSPSRTIISSTNYSRNLVIEDMTLKNSPVANASFQEIMNKASFFQSDNVYFTSIYMNTFENIRWTSPTLFSFDGFNIKQNFINVEKNVFTQVITSDYNFKSSLMYFSSVTTMLIAKNNFTSIKGGNNVFLLDQANSSSLLNISSNVFDTLFVSACVIYAANSIDNFEFNNNTLQNSKIYSNMLSINVMYTLNDWILNNNTLKLVTFEFDPTINQVEQSALIGISCRNASNDRQVILSNSLYQDIKIPFQYLGNPILKINLFTLQTYQAVSFVNITLYNISLLSFGNLIQIINSHSFSLNDSLIHKIDGGDSNGLINLLTPRTLISNSTIHTCSGDGGAGVFVLNIPAVTLTTEFRVVNSNFSTLYLARYGSILTARALTRREILGNSEYLPLNFEMSNSCIEDVNSIFGASQILCENCKITNVTFLTGDNSQIISLTDQAKGIFNLEGLKVLSLKPYSVGLSPFIEIKNSSASVIISNMEFFGGGNSFYLASLDSGTLTLLNSTFSDLTLLDNSFINVTQYDSLLISDMYQVMMPSIIITSTIFSNFKYGGVPVTFDLELLNWPNFAYKKAWDQPRSIISVFTPALVYIQGCKFEDLRDLSAIYYEIALDETYGEALSEIRVEDSLFKNITFTIGPALAILPKALGFSSYRINVSIINSLFEANHADLGGALLIYNSTVYIIDSKFVDNSAELGGDAIYLGGLSERDIHTTNVTFKKAKNSHHRNIGYEPNALNISFVYNQSNNMVVNFGIIRVGDFWHTFIKNISSEELSGGYLRLDFVDDYENSAVDFSKSYDGTFIVKGNLDYHISTTFNAQIQPSNGTSQNISLSNLFIAGNAYSQINLVLSYHSDRYSNDIPIEIILRPCMSGEYNDSVTCVSCPLGAYSFQPDQNCTKCPTNATCVRQSQICPNVGFWNSRRNSTVIHACRPGRCLNEQDCLNCASGYAGPLCEGCDFGNSYVENGYLKCGICEDPNMSLVYTILFAVAYFLYQLFSIYILYAASGKTPKPGREFLTLRKVERSYYTKSFLTYTQLMSILYMHSDELYNSLGLAPQLGNPSALITYGTQCSLIALGVQSADFLYSQTLFQIIYPVVQFVTISFVVAITTLIKRDIDYKKIIATTALYLILGNQPGIVNSLGLFLSCRTLDDLGFSFITAHPNWKCDTEQYVTFAHSFVIPSLGIWCGVVPILLFLVLYTNRQDFGEDKAKSSLAVLTSGLQKECYFWGIVLMALKLCLSFLVFSLQQKSQTQIFLSLVLLWTYQSSVRLLKPYKNPSFNTFQIVLMNLIMFNIIVTQYLLDPSNGTTIPRISILANGIANGAVLLFMSWKILSLSYLNILSFIERRIMKRKIERPALLINGDVFNEIETDKML